MNFKAALIGIGCLALTGNALADHKDYRDYGDRGSKKHRYEQTVYAVVTDVDPIYNIVQVSEPVRNCWVEPVRYTQHQSYTSTVLGGIIGGVVGNQIGKGKGKDVATIAGTILGASIGNDVSHDHAGYASYSDQQRCNVTYKVHEERQLDGYLVSYRYNGRRYQTRMNHRPGRTIAVNVDVRPVW